VVVARQRLVHERRDQGLTLIELLVSAGLLAVGIVGLSGLVVTAQVATRGASERLVARQRLHSRVAELRALLRSQPPPDAFDDVVDLDQTTTSPVIVEGAAPGTLRVLTFRTELPSEEPGKLRRPRPGEDERRVAVDEAAANAALLPLGIASLDLDLDGKPDGLARPITLKLVPVLVRLTWRSGTWRPGTPTVPGGDPGQDSRMELAALLY
jgi:hypothetical protein